MVKFFQRMEMKDVKSGPPEPTFLTLVLKTFAGFGAGAIGTLILLVIFLLGASILQPAFTGTAIGTGIHPLFIFVFMAMVFLTTLGSNILGPLLFGYIQEDKYGRPATAVAQIFILNLVIFAIMAPVYLLVFSLGLDLTGFLAGIHVMVSAMASIMVLEIIGNLRYALLGVYSMMLSILFATGVIFVFYQFVGNRNVVLLLFVTLPILWTFVGFISTIVELFYVWLFKLYGKDFFASSATYGREYGEDEEEIVKPDVTGREFLNK